MSETREAASPVVREAKVVREEIWDRMVLVERALTAPAGADPAGWWARALEALQGLRLAFQAHVAVTEAPKGVHDEIVAFAPRLAHARDRLVHDHVEIGAALDQLCGPALPPGGVDEAREAGYGLLGLLSRHRHRGSEFVYEAYDFDMGGGD